MRILVLSSLPRDTGCWLRATYLARALGRHATVELVRPRARCLPLMLDVLLSLPRNLVAALRTDADVLIGMKPFPNVTVPLLAAKWLRGRRVVVDVDDADHLWFRGWRRWLVALAQSWAPRRFDIVTFHNPLLRAFVESDLRVDPARVVRLPQGVDFSVFGPAVRAFEPDTLLFVGHLNIASDLADVLEVVRRVQERRRVHFTVVGGGPCLARFEALARSLGVDAHFTGPVDNHAAARLMSRADVCLVLHRDSPANRLRSSMKMRECLALGRKVVCNDVGELPEFAAFTYASSSNPDDCAARVIEVLGGGDGRERVGAEFVAREFDWQTIGRDFFGELERRFGEGGSSAGTHVG